MFFPYFDLLAQEKDRSPEPGRTSLPEGLLDPPEKDLVLRTEVQHTNPAQEKCLSGLRWEWSEYSAIHLPGAPKRVLEEKLQVKTQELLSHISTSVYNTSQQGFGPCLGKDPNAQKEHFFFLAE